MQVQVLSGAPESKVAAQAAILFLESMMMNYTYILRCCDGTYYTGWTNDLEKRLASHNDGTGSKYTRTRRPVKLVYCEAFETKQEAMRREWEIKKKSREDKQKLIDAAGSESEIAVT